MTRNPTGKLATMFALFLLSALGPSSVDLSAEDRGASPVGKIKHDCDGEKDSADPPDPTKGTGWVSYWETATGSEVDITVFVTSSCECEMSLKLTHLGKDQFGRPSPPVVLSISKGQTKVASAPKASKLEIRCLKKEGGSCEGTYQFW